MGPSCLGSSRWCLGARFYGRVRLWRGLRVEGDDDVSVPPTCVMQPVADLERGLDQPEQCRPSICVGIREH